MQSGTNGKILLLGLGNDLLTDDAIGLNVVRQVQRRLAGVETIDVKETLEMGLSLLDFVAGYRDLVVVDAVQTQQAPPGFLHEVEGTDLKVLPNIAPHFFGIGEMLALGRELGLTMPERVKVLAIEIQDAFLMGTEMTAPLQAALPQVVERVVAVLQAMAEEKRTVE